MKEHRIEDFIPALVDDDEDVRRYARRLLDVDGNEDVSPFLTDLLENDSVSVRRSAAFALGKLGNPMGTDVLVDALGDDDPTVQFKAAEALANLGDGRALPALVNGLGEEDETVRLRSANLLGVLGDAGAVPHLLAALKDPSIRVRVEAARSLRKLDMSDHRVEAVPAFIEVLERRSYDATHHRLREEAAGALGQLGDSRAVPALVAALEYRHDSYLHTCAANALAVIGDTSAVPGLIVALNHGPASLKGDAAEALGQLGDSRAVGPLVSVLHWTRNRDEGWLAGLTAEALGRIGDPRAIPHLLAELAHVGEREALSIAQALRQLGDTLAVSDMIEWLESPDAETWRRRMAAVVLEELGDASAVLPLMGSLEDDHWTVRRAAAALGVLGDDRATQPLAGLVCDGEFHVRRAVVRALGRLGGSLAISTLESALDDEDGSIREAAESALEGLRREGPPQDGGSGTAV